MFKYLVLVFLQCLVTVFCFTKPDPLCKADDAKCYTNIGREVFKSATLGDVEVGTQPLDPLHLKLTEAQLPSIKYTLTDTTITGFKDLIVNELKFVPPNYLRFDLSFPYYQMTGDYEIAGKLINLPLEGKGKVYVNATNIQMSIDTLKEIYEENGKKHLKLTVKKFKPELMGTMHLHMDNLFNGNKELADSMLKFINENQKTVASQLQSPLITKTTETLFNNVNQVLAKIPLEDLIV